MDIEALVWIGVGTAAAGARAVPLWRGVIHTDAFAAQIVKLLDADKPTRALKLCGAAPHAPIARIVRVTLEAAFALPAHESQARSRATLEEIFNEQREVELTAARKGRWLGPLGALLAIMGAVIALASETAPPAHAGFAAIAVGLALSAHRRVNKLASNTDALRESLVIAAAGLASRHGGRLEALDV